MERKTVACTSHCFDVTNPLANEYAFSLNVFHKDRVLNGRSVKAHLSKSSPPVTSSRISEISVSVSKISFRRIYTPQREKQQRINYAVNYAVCGKECSIGLAKSCTNKIISSNINQKCMYSIVSQSFH